MATILQTKAEFSIEKLETQAGYQAISLSETPMIENYTNILHIIEVDKFQSTLASIEYDMKSIFSLPHDRLIINQLETEISKIRHNLDTIVPHRHKRGLINLGGKTFNWLFGTMDSDDRLQIEEKLKTIDLNNHNLITNTNKQIKINTDLQENLNILQDRINENQKLIKNAIERPNNTMQKDTKQLYFLSILNNLQLLDSQIDKIQENIAFAKYNVMSRSILTVEEIEAHDIDIFKFKEIKCSLLQNVEKFILVISIPNLTKDLASKYKLIPVPNINEEEVILPDENILTFRNQVYVDNENKYIKELKEATKCTKSLMNKNYEHCMKIKNKDYKIIEINPSMLVVKNAENSSLTDCNNIKHILNNNYIINYSNCTLIIDNVRFYNKEKNINRNVIIPNYAKPENIESITSLKEIHLKQIKNIEEIKEVGRNLKSNSILTYLNLPFVIIFLIIITIICLIKTKIVKIKVDNHQEKIDKNITQESINLNDGGIIFHGTPLTV